MKGRAPIPDSVPGIGLSARSLKFITDVCGRSGLSESAALELMVETFRSHVNVTTNTLLALGFFSPVPQPIPGPNETKEPDEQGLPAEEFLKSLRNQGGGEQNA